MQQLSEDQEVHVPKWNKKSDFEPDDVVKKTSEVKRKNFTQIVRGKDQKTKKLYVTNKSKSAVQVYELSALYRSVLGNRR